MLRQQKLVNGPATTLKKTEIRNENDHNVSIAMPCTCAGVKLHLEKLNENINSLEAKNDALRKTSKIMLDNNSMRKIQMIPL